MNEEIKPTHLERAAHIYLRQSAMHQVTEHQESRCCQCEPREQAQRWKFRSVFVTNEDLGCSGAGSVDRPGFGRRLAAVCDGQVGAVLAVEASRKVRNNRD